MADQASVSAGAARPGPGSSGPSLSNGTPERQVIGGIAGFGTDVATLAELQAQLALIDLKQWVAQVRLHVVLMASGLVVALGAVPVVLLGVAALVASAWNLSDAWAMVLTGGVVLTVTLLLVATAALKIGSSFSCFRRSREELTRNLAWIKTVLLYSGRSVARRGRSG
jgi:hypothetical protein